MSVAVNHTEPCMGAVAFECCSFDCVLGAQGKGIYARYHVSWVESKGHVLVKIYSGLTLFTSPLLP